MFREQRKEYKMDKEEWGNINVANEGQEEQIEIEFEEPVEEPQLVATFVAGTALVVVLPQLPSPLQ